MSVAIVIPVRYASSRFPGKPLAQIAGRSLVQRTFEVGSAVQGVDAVYVATDDARIADHAKTFGAKVLMTRPECANGTERMYDALKQLPTPPEIALNLQGDAPLTPPWVLEALVKVLKNDPAIGIATPAVRLKSAALETMIASKKRGESSGTLVTFNKAGDALYFSKTFIPNIRDGHAADAPVYQHIGLYGFRWAALKQYVSLAPTPLEKVEMLEQLRALEHGMPIRVVEVDLKGRTQWPIDRPEDVQVVEKIIKAEGELV